MGFSGMIFFFSLMVNERMQVYAELRSKERPELNTFAQKEDAGRCSNVRTPLSWYGYTRQR